MAFFSGRKIILPAQLNRTRLCFGISYERTWIEKIEHDTNGWRFVARLASREHSKT